MLRVILQQNMFFYAIAGIGILGVISQLILNGIYERLMKDAQNDGAKKGKFMKRLRQQYVTNKRLNEGLTNVSVFIKRSIYEYRCFGLSLHQWRRFGGTTLVLCLGLALAGYLLSGMQGFAVNITQNYLWAGAAAFLLLIGTQAVIDVGYKRNYLQIQLEDYLSNSGVGNLYEEVTIAESVEKEAADTKSASNINTKQQAMERERDKEEAKTAAALGVRRRSMRPLETRAQKDKRELKQNLAKLKEGLDETAAEREHNKERNTEILKQMDPAEQERVIREVLKEFLS